MSGATNSAGGTSPGRGRGRGRGVDSSPLRKPERARRPGSQSNSPRAVGDSSSSSIQNSPKSTMSDSSVRLNQTVNASSSLNVTAAEFVPRATKSQPSVVISEPSSSETPYDQYDDLVMHIEIVLNDLLMHPSRLDYASHELAQHFTVTLVDEKCMTIAADVIFEWAISQPHFSYTCARLIQELSEVVLNNHNGEFRQHILKRCHTEHKEHKHMIEKTPERFQAFTVFMAELYTKITNPTGRLVPLRTAILDLLDVMLLNISNDIGKTIGQTLKMCGANLDDDLQSANQSQKMDELMGQLEKTVEAASLSSRMNDLLRSVIRLRSSNWGRSVSPAQSPQLPLYQSDSFTQEPVFYSTDGTEISRNQAGFSEDTAYPDYNQVGPYGGVQWSDGNGDTTAASTWSNADDTAAGDAERSEVSEEYYEPEDLDILIVADEDEMGMTQEMYDDFQRFTTT